MASRATHLLLAIGLLLLIGATPFPVRFAGELKAAQTALSAGRPELALPQLQSALVREPAMARVSLKAIETALRANRPDLALGQIQSLPAPVRSMPQVDCYMAQAETQMAAWHAALVAADAAGPLCVEPLFALQALANEMVLEGNYPVARSLLTELAARMPQEAPLQAQLGLLLAVDQPDRALARLSLAGQLDPQLALPQDLIETIQAVLEQGDPAYALAQIGQSLARNNQWPLAAQAFGAALEIEPTYTEARAYYGLALDRSGLDGLNQLERAIEEAPTAALPQQLLGKHWRSVGDAPRALQAFEAAAVLAPDDPILAADLGAAYAAVGDLPAAEQAFVRAAQLAPDDPVMWQLLAHFTVDYEYKLPQLGIPSARRAVAIRPDASEALDLLGYAYYLNGDWELAERFIALAAGADPYAAPPLYHLGLLQISRGELAEGKQTLRLALGLDPDGRVGRLAQRSLENLP